MAGFVALVAGLLIALYVCWRMIDPFFDVLLWAAVLAVVFYPMHRRLRDRIRKATPAAALSTVLVVLLILLPVTFISVAVVHELSGVAQSFQTPGQGWNVTVPAPVTRAIGWIGKYVDIDVDKESARKFIADRMQTWGSALAASTLVVVGGAVGAITQMALVVFT